MRFIKKRMVFILILGQLFLVPQPLKAGALEPEEDGPAAIAALTLDEMSELVLKNNLDIQIAGYNAYIERTRGKGAESVFDTMFNARAFYLDDQTKSASTLAGTKTSTNEYNLGLSKKLPTGTTLSVDAGDTRTFSNSALTSLSPSHEAIVKFSLHQPIGSNFFGLIDRGSIKITKLDIANSDFEALGRIEKSLALAQINYWKLVLAHCQLKIGRQMLEKAETFYASSKKKHELGLIEEAELYAAQANLLKRKNSVETLMHQLLIVKNNLLLDLHEEDLNMQVIPLDVFSVKDVKISAQEHMNYAVRKNREYLQAKNSLMAKGINLSMKNNGLWPEIDLEVSLADNGLELEQDKAWENVSAENNPELFLGLTVSIPLENRAAKSQREKAQLEKTKALVELKKIEYKIMVEVINAVDAINNRKESIKLNRQIARLQENKLAFEEKRFAWGRSESDTLIRYQEDLLNAQLALAQSLFEHEKVSVELKSLENSLLEEYWQGQL
ncbi:MAG: TolC family protein [Candidatus Omnitrophica bacterium]|nr:TolC family protein [Candidatus Omnitrophota bacterium]